MADPGEITLELPEAGAVFDPEDEVTIKGTVEAVTSGEVDIRVQSEVTGDKILDRKVPITSDGTDNGVFEHKFKLPEDGYTEDPIYEFDSFEVAVFYEDKEAYGSFDVTLEQLTLEFALDKETYSPGEQVTVTGTVSGSEDGDSLVIDVTDPDVEKIVEATIVTVTDEEFSYSFSIPSDAQAGEYSVNIVYKDTLDDYKTFIVEGDAASNTDLETRVRTDSAEYDPGDQVKITGTAAGANDGDVVEITVLGPDDQPLLDVNKKNLAVSAGNFTYTFTLDSDAEGGTYEVSMKFQEETKAATFRVLGVTTSVPTDGGPAVQLPLKVGKIRIETDGEKYEQGDQVQITGTIEGADDDDEAEITVFGPDSEPIDDVDKKRRMIVDERFSLSFNLDRESDLGLYKVLVQALGDEEDTLFIVEGDGGSTDDPFVVETDQEEYAPGDRVEISGKVEDVEDGKDVLVTVYDPEGEVLSNVDEKKDSISDEEFALSFDLDQDASVGRYKVFVDADGDNEDTVFTVTAGGSAPQTGVSITINDESLAPDEIALATITVQGAEAGDTVEYTTFGPDNNEVPSLSGQGEVNETSNRHSFSVSLTDGLAGCYAIQAEFRGKQASTFFDFQGEDGGGGDSASFVETDKIQYEQGETVLVSGTIEGAEDETLVNIIVENFEGELVNDNVATSGDSFTYEFDLPGDAAGGTYRLDALPDTGPGNTQLTFFAVLLSDNTVTLGVQDSYEPGDDVEIVGNADGLGVDEFVAVTVQDPERNIVGELDFELFEPVDGEFTIQFSLPTDALPGRYMVEVLAPSFSDGPPHTEIFTVEGEDGGGTALPTVTTDKKNYDAEEQVVIAGTVPGADDDAEVKVSIIGPDGNALSGADEEPATISSEDFEFDLILPSDGEEGLYRVKVEMPGDDELYTFFGVGQEEDTGGGTGLFTVTTENTLYNLGNDVIITGTVDGNDGQKVRLNIKKPDTEAPEDGASKKSVNPEIEGGEFSYTLSLSERDDEGVYFIEAEFSGEEVFSYFDVEEKDFDIEIETDEMEYELGNIIEITGSVKGAEDGDKVEITVTTPNGEVVEEVDEVKDKVVDEEFEVRFRLDQGMDVGVYMILVNFEDDESIEYGYFDVLGDRNAELVRVITDKNSYAPGDDVQIAGVVSIAEDGEDVDISVYDPFDSPIPVVFHQKLDVNGQQFSFQFALPNYAPEGVYEVHAIFFDHADFAKFQVVSKDANDLDIGALVQALDNKLFFDGVAVDFNTNSELSSIRLDSAQKKLTMQLETIEGTEGAVQISIGKILRGNYTVFVNGEETNSFTLKGDPKSEDAIIEITYPKRNSELVIVGTQIVPEFPVIALIPLAAFFVIVVALGRMNLRTKL